MPNKAGGNRLGSPRRTPMAAPKNSNTRERLQTLEGVLDRLVYAGEKDDFIVGRLVVRGRREAVTVVGSLPQPRPGETLIL
jgi:hypothetical protein